MDGGFPQLYRNIYREKVKYQFACFGENRRNLTGFQICHSEERSDVGISQYPAASWESYRRNRECLPEIAPQGHFLALRAQGATSPFGLPAMTNLGALRRRMCAAVIVNLQGAQGAPLQAALEIRAKNTPIRSDGGACI